MDLCPEKNGDKPELAPTWSNLTAHLPWTPGQDMETTAGMRVFTSVMLHAWRQRRADVRRLQKVVEHLQRKTMYSKNDLLVSNTLMRVEQKRCLELQLELKRSTLNISQFVELQKRANQMADNLHAAQLKQRHLKLQLSMEQAKVQQLMEEKQQQQMRNLESSYKEREDAYLLELEEKSEALRKMRSTIERLEQELRRDQNIFSKYFRNVIGLEEQCLKRMGHQENHNTNNNLPAGTSSRSNIQIVSMAEEFRFGQLFSKVHNIISSAALFLLFVLLPNKSARSGCSQPKNPQACHK
ncbi:trichohyalin isoform X3 [Drosophila grimshawi]|uniref:trichohyalin isoform X3 n=1 Tax=Drosophila grimshawi TaxID=7222 RepID=UPI000C86EA6A|nr:trichohyalin isoform X3 [Drosophila grimshawi]